MSLNQKVALIVVLVFTLSAGVSVAIQQSLIMPSFVSLERDTAEKNLQRAIEGIGRELALIGPSVYDWSSWTDTYEFANGEYPEYVADNLDLDSTMPALQINYLGVYRLDGSALWNRALDLEDNVATDLGQLSANHLPVNHPLMKIQGVDDVISGLIDTPVSPLLIHARPILTNEGKGPPAGFFVMGRFLDAASVSRLSAQTQLEISLTPVAKGVNASSRSEWNAGSEAGISHDTPVFEGLENQWEGHVQLGDLYGEPLLTLQVNTPREISAQGSSAVNMALLSLAATGLFTMIVLWFALQRVLLRPLKALADHAQRVGESDDLHIRLNLQRGDEIGVLAENFDHMVDSLAQARRKIVDQSYRSGIAEMASGVLHNIGNAITPLMVKLEGLASELRSAPTAELNQAVSELADEATPESRRTDLARFVELAGVELAELCDSGLNDVNRAVAQVGNIREILSDQERMSRSARVVEPVDIAGMASDAAVALTEAGLTSMIVEVDASVMECGPAAGARAALQQVVTNLLINAAEAVEECDRGNGRLRISAQIGNSDGQKCIVYRFEDNGAGVNASIRGELFQRGFSTKGREGSGYGLHWSANTLQALGGDLRCVDAGDEPGATFEMRLPAANAVGASANDPDGGAVPDTTTGTGL